MFEQQVNQDFFLSAYYFDNVQINLDLFCTLNLV